MRKIIFSSAAFLATSLMSSAPVLATDLPSLKEAPAPVAAPLPDGWRFEATINGWAPSAITNVGVRNLPTVSDNVGFFKLLQHLNGVAPVSVIARNENFIVGLDLFWSAASAGAHFRGLPAAEIPGGSNIHLRLDETFLTAFGGIRLPIQLADLSVYGILGARFTNVGATIGLTKAIPGLGLSTSQSKDWADPIIGFTAHYVISDKWFLAGEADIGGGEDKSATWQTFAAVGYIWTQNISSTVGFRALYVTYQQPNNFNGSFRFQETLLGPQATINYLF